jgi:uncharacterized membrane protein YhiD involved in acid resistance
MAVGTGAWLLALAATVIIWIILVLLSKAENHQKRNDESDLSDDSGEPMPLHDNISGGGHVREVHPLDD